MTIYNKTTVAKKYGYDKYTVTLPPAAQNGQRGLGVDVSANITAFTMSKTQVDADKQSGAIEIEY